MERRLNPRVAFRQASVGLIVIAALVVASPVAARKDIAGPPGSIAFGTTVTMLPNSNFVVTDPMGPVTSVGAVYLYSPDGLLISTLTGSSVGDQVGSGGIVVLSNGNFVIRSPHWRNGDVSNAGAVTWANGITGISGVVSPTNSLVGTTVDEFVGFGVVYPPPSFNEVGNVYALGNGNYVVTTPGWDNAGAQDAGAATWADGSTGLSGTISPANSLVGSTAYDQVGLPAIAILDNDNYVVISRGWDNVGAVDAGAVTWGDGDTGISGAVSVNNSVVGTHKDDEVGCGGVTALHNGNFVISSPCWGNGVSKLVGAVTWADGSVGLAGEVSAANSLVGTSAFDFVGFPRVVALSNGHYVVASWDWNNGSALHAGAVTWADGNSGRVGEVSSSNSLVGTTANDYVGTGVTALTNGNYVVSSTSWHNGATNVGAVTWANGSSGLTGPVSLANSLVGTQAFDSVGQVTALSNGNYVVRSSHWRNGGVAHAGAVTWADGSTGRTGVVSAANSLVGTATDDSVGSGGITALSNGNYVVSSPAWDNPVVGAVNAGAVTWGNGSVDLVGTVSANNSLVGASGNDRLGFSGATALSDGHYVVGSPYWSNGGTAAVGAVTWADGSTGLTGTISAANSLVGSTDSDWLGTSNFSNGVTAQSDGNYVVRSSEWDLGLVRNAGAVTLASGRGGSVGALRSHNTVTGATLNEGLTLVFAYDPTREQLIVGRPLSNIVTLLTLPVFGDGFE